MLAQTTGNSTLTGTSGADTLVAVNGTGAPKPCKGNGAGNDTYSYASGNGQVLISESSGTDTLKLGSGLTSSNVTFSETTNGADLLIVDGTTGDQVDIFDQLTVAADQVETLVYGDGTSIGMTSALTLYAQSANSHADWHVGERHPDRGQRQCEQRVCSAVRATMFIRIHLATGLFTSPIPEGPIR